MAKRCFDIVLATLGMLIAAPVILVAALGTIACDGRPVFYRARRSGMNGRNFTLWKLRTMRSSSSDSRRALISQEKDPRVFWWGAVLRKLKIDELPQLWNVLLGDMSLVGPRPEDPQIVAAEYDALAWSTLDVRPGLAGVSSIYNYTHGEKLLSDSNAAEVYCQQLLPVKIALESAYLERASLLYDVRLIGRTVAVLLAVALGRSEFADPPEMERARSLLHGRS